MKYCYIFIVTLLVLMPIAVTVTNSTTERAGISEYVNSTVVHAAEEPKGLVTCSGPDCNFCSFVEMVNRIVNWLFSILAIVAVLMIVYAGFGLVTSGGDVSAMTNAKSMLTNVIIGFVIVLAAWLIVDTVIKVLIGDEIDNYGPWNSAGKTCGGIIPPAGGSPGNTEILI